MDKHYTRIRNEKIHYADGFALKQAGLKVTHPRLKILQLFETSDVQHFSAEEMYKLLLEEDSDIGLATVYRVLTQFETAGILTRHNFERNDRLFIVSMI